MRSFQGWIVVVLAVLLAPAGAFGIVLPNINLTLTTPNSTYNTLNMTVLLTTALGPQSQSKSPTVIGSSSANLQAVFDPVSHQATLQDITFNKQVPGQTALQDETFSFYSGVETISTSSILFSPYTAVPPTVISGSTFPANQVSAEFNSGTVTYSGQDNGTEDYSTSPYDATNTSPGSGTLSISAPTMSGSVATYTATLTLPLAVSQTLNDSGATAQINVTGSVQASGTFQFDFGPRTMSWNAASGDFTAGGNWDAGFAPRSGDTVAIANSGTSTLSTANSATPAAVWLGNGASSAGTLTVATGGSLSTGAMVLGHSGGRGTLVLSGGTLLTPSITEGSGGGNSGVIYFDGGTLEASASSTQFISGLSAADVRAGGIKINTNGHNITILQPFSRDPALQSAPDGGFTKDGSGTLTLASQGSLFTGGTTVLNGTLILTHSNALANGTNLTIGKPLLFAPIIPDAQVDAAQTQPASVPEPRTLLILGVSIFFAMYASLRRGCCLRRK